MLLAIPITGCLVGEWGETCACAVFIWNSSMGG